VLRPERQTLKAKPVQQVADAALGHRHTEALGDGPGQVGTPPACHAMPGEIRATANSFSNFGLPLA